MPYETLTKEFGCRRHAARTLLRMHSPCSCENIVFPTFDAFDERNTQVHFGCGGTRMAGLQYGEGRMMIDSVVWAQYINVTDTQTDSHVVTPIAP